MRKVTLQRILQKQLHKEMKLGGKQNTVDQKLLVINKMNH